MLMAHRLGKIPSRTQSECIEPKYRGRCNEHDCRQLCDALQRTGTDAGGGSLGALLGINTMRHSRVATLETLAVYKRCAGS